MNKVRQYIINEPVVVRAVVVIGVTIAAALGFDLDVDAVLGVVAVVVGAGAVSARGKVTPGDKASAH